MGCKEFIASLGGPEGTKALWRHRRCRHATPTGSWPCASSSRVRYSVESSELR